LLKRADLPAAFLKRLDRKSFLKRLDRKPFLKRFGRKRCYGVINRRNGCAQEG